jgi:hypothetical protein
MKTAALLVVIHCKTKPCHNSWKFGVNANAGQDNELLAVSDIPT